MDTRKIGDGSQELPTRSMLDDNPSIPADDELAVVEPVPAPPPAPKAIPSIVNFQPAPTRTESHPVPNSAPALLAAAVKAAPAPLPTLTPAPAAPPALPTLTPVLKAVDPSDPKAALKRTVALASLVQAMNAEAQRALHALRTTLDADGISIDATANPASFENAARLLLVNDSIVMQARFLESQVVIEE